ncbi:DsbA family oxidoreductase [Gracilibacillus sp. YIM 98692]|uniref:DsbA family oxidoreductase n=1 Tax=Gracilibacillus sp. YIM 98692 TaxID=2663532 RepID=UPI0013CFD48F|nr:DsbA family oxidoreductase [Gracilibacillus sp. YIM 98692]
MQIEIWSDFVCPFCYIGKERLEQAIERFPKKLDIHIKYRSFELDPNTPAYNGKSIHELIAKKYNMSLEQAKQTNKQLGEQARSVGLEFVFDTMKPTNTFDVHRISKYAKTVGKENEFVENTLYHYFTLSADLSDLETLVHIGEKSGLEKQHILDVLQNQDRYVKEVRNDQHQAQKLGITGVPFFVFNQKYAVSGAQPIETFMQALEKVEEEERGQFENLSNSKGSYCDGDQCH